MTGRGRVLGKRGSAATGVKLGRTVTPKPPGDTGREETGGMGFDGGRKIPNVGLRN